MSPRTSNVESTVFEGPNRNRDITITVVVAVIFVLIVLYAMDMLPFGGTTLTTPAK
jgi:hypothetical protein